MNKAEEILKKYRYLKNSALDVQMGQKPKWRVTQENALKAMEEYASLRVAEETKKMREALEEIANPVAAMQKQAESEGCHLNGAIALQFASDPKYLQGIAIKALDPNK